MKSTKSLFLFSFLCLAIACKKEGKPSLLPCTGDCLFVINDGNGTIVKMTCFNRFGILTDDPNTPALNTIYGIPDQMPARFEEEGKAVRFSGAFRVNTLTPQFPDPSIGLDDLYQMKLEEISEKN